MPCYRVGIEVEKREDERRKVVGAKTAGGSGAKIGLRGRRRREGASGVETHTTAGENMTASGWHGAYRVRPSLPTAPPPITCIHKGAVGE